MATLGVAASLGAVLYGVSSSLPFLASSAVSDVSFGALNACALRAAPTRIGFAVSPDGRALAAYSGERTVRCALGPDGGASADDVPGAAGVTAAAFDFDGGLWLAREGVLHGDAGFDEVKPVAMVGTRHGIVAAESSGRVVALRPGGEVAAVAQLPAPLEGSPQLIVSSDGERAALLVSGGVFVWDTQTLDRVRAEAPCRVEAAWWRAGVRRLLLECAPDFALEWDVDSGEKAAAPKKDERARSVLVPKLETYMSACEQLPCTAEPP